MKKSLSGIEIKCVVSELQDLIGSRIAKISQPVKDELYIQFYGARIGKKLLKIVIPGFLHLTEQREQSQRPLALCQSLRRWINGAFLREINQPKLERIVEFVLEAKEGTFRLLIELFARGNVVLCRDDYTIIYALEQVRFREREIRSKLAYAFPKQMADLTNFKVEDLRELLQKTDKESLVTFLAVSVGVSGLYAEEICTASHVDKSKISLNQDELDRVYKAIVGLFEREPKPNVVYNNGVIDVVPFELEVYKNNDKKYFQGYNEAIAAFLKEGPARRPKEDNLAKERERLLKIIKVQTEGIAEMEKEVEENQRKGQLVYEHYQEIKATIDKINTDLKRLSKEELEKKYRKVSEIDLRDKTIILRI